MSAEVRLFDFTREPCVMRPRRWVSWRRRDPSTFLGVVLHQWAARVGINARQRELAGGEVEAFARRAIRAPYTISCGVSPDSQTPVVAVVHPVERYTNASDAGNASYISVGVMGLFAFQQDRAVPGKHTERSEVLQAALDVALEVAASMLPAGSPRLLITHRQTINGLKDHERCPGELPVAMACASRVVAEGLLVPNPDVTLLADWGRPWPAWWRRHLVPPAQGVLDV